MKNQIEIRWLVRRASLLLGLNLAITDRLALVVMLDPGFR